MFEHNAEDLAGKFLNYWQKKKEHNFKVRKWAALAGTPLLLILLVSMPMLFLNQFGYSTYLPTEAEAVEVIENMPVPLIAGGLFPGQGDDATDGYLSGMTLDQIKEMMQKAADESMFSFKINARPVFENGGAKGNLRIENPRYNIYPMVVQIFLDDTDEIIYDSGGIMPNQHVADANLLRELDAGAYNATAVLNAYDPDTQAWQGKAQAVLIITVQN